MTSDVGSLIASAVSGGGLAYIGGLAQSYFKSRSERASKAGDTELKIDQHRDQLVLDLLAAARAENAVVRVDLASARQEIQTLRELEGRVAHFDQCLEHLEVLLKARQNGNIEEIRAAERMAQAFINRMARLANVRGTIANEIQIVASAESLREATEPMMPPTPPATY